MNQIKVSVYLSEADKWLHRPLYQELIAMLHKHQLMCGVALRAVAGFTPEGMVETSLFHAGNKSPIIVQFIDTAKKIETILPELKNMLPHSLILSVPVEIMS